MITFPTNVNAQTGTIEIRTVAGSVLFESINVPSAQVTGSGGSTITIDPTGNLAGNTEYFVTVTAGAFDEATASGFGAWAVISNPDWTFTTAAAGGGLPSCIAFAAPAGTTNTWMGCNSSDWGDGGNWSTGMVPVAGDNIYVPNNASNILIIDEVATCSRLIQQIGAVVRVNYNAGGQLRVRIN